MNTVGTFGITSASYYWNRVGATVGRISQYVVGKSATVWHMLVADDYHLEAGGEQYRFAPITFFIVCAVAGVPLSRNKTSGGESVTWVGFELLHKTRQLGISQRRADWFRSWSSEVAGSSTVHMGSFEEGLGRVMFVAGALKYERPFLGPLCKFLALHPRDSKRAFVGVSLFGSFCLLAFVPPWFAFWVHIESRDAGSTRLDLPQLGPHPHGWMRHELFHPYGWMKDSLES